MFTATAFTLALLRAWAVGRAGGRREDSAPDGLAGPRGGLAAARPDMRTGAGAALRASGDCRPLPPSHDGRRGDRAGLAGGDRRLRPQCCIAKKAVEHNRLSACFWHRRSGWADWARSWRPNGSRAGPRSGQPGASPSPFASMLAARRPFQRAHERLRDLGTRHLGGDGIAGPGPRLARPRRRRRPWEFVARSTQNPPRVSWFEALD